MIKGIFILQDFNREVTKQALELGANAVFVGHKKLDGNLVKRLHRSGVKVFAEVGLFVGEELWEKFPDSHPVDSKNQKIGKEDWYAGICPNHPQVRKEKLEEVEKIISDFEVDGVWLDFIRYPTHWEVPSPKLLDVCYCPNCLEKFAGDTGSKDPKGEIWTWWKCDQITNFVAEAADIVRSSKREIQLGLFAVPWTKRDFDVAIRKVVGQDFERLLTYVDVVSPMTYHKMCGRDVSWIADTVRYFHKLTGKPVLPLIQTENKPTAISVEEFQQSLSAAARPPSEGVIVFFLEDLLKQPEKLEVVKDVFKRQQTA